MTNYSEITSPGGVHKTIRELGTNLSLMGHKVTILQANPLNLPKGEVYEGFRIIRIGTKFGDLMYGVNPEMYFYLKKHFEELNPDVIHIHGYHTLFSPEILLIFRKLLKIKTPIIFTPHYDPLNHSTLAGKLFGGLYDKLIGKKFLKIPNYIISISEFEANNVSKIFGLHGNIKVIPHGVKEIRRLSKKEKKEGPIKLLYAGYLLDYKGVQYILKAIHELIHSEKIKDVELTIIGDGEYKKQLELHSEKLNINDYITWYPFLAHSDVLEEMKKADIFLLLSKSEGYGLVVAEALAMGTPAIITNGTALEEFTKESGCFGVDYPPNPVILSELIKEISSKDIEVGPFSSKIRTWDKVAEDYESEYLNLIHLRRGK